jgi:hypothetical protein
MEEVEETSGEISQPGTRCAGGDVDGLIVAMRLLHCNNETTERMESHRRPS